MRFGVEEKGENGDGMRADDMVVVCIRKRGVTVTGTPLAPSVRERSFNGISLSFLCIMATVGFGLRSPQKRQLTSFGRNAVKATSKATLSICKLSRLDSRIATPSS